MIPPRHRKPLVNVVTDEITQAVDPTALISHGQKQKALLTAAAIANVFTGDTIPDHTDLDDWKYPGVYRFNNTISNGPPCSTVNLIGYLVVHAVHRNPTNGTVQNERIRQLAYPDAVNESTPYTRVWDGVTWSPWNTLGGNLRRVLLTQNLTGMINTLYYSFEDWTLTLPDVSLYPLGTRCALEQYEGTGKVIYGDKEIVTTPSYLADNDGNVTNTIDGAQIYMFEICELEDKSKAWVMDVDNNYDGIFEGLKAHIASVEEELDIHKDPSLTVDPHTMYVLEKAITNVYNDEASLTVTLSDGTTTRTFSTTEQVLSKFGAYDMWTKLVKYTELAERGIYPNAAVTAEGSAFNYLINQGLYIINKGTNVAPYTGASGYLFVFRGNGNTMAQVFVSEETGTTRIFYRTGTSVSGTSTFKAWMRVVSEKDLSDQGIYPSAFGKGDGVNLNSLFTHGMYEVTATAASSPTGKADWSGLVTVGQHNNGYFQMAVQAMTKKWPSSGAFNLQSGALYPNGGCGIADCPMPAAKHIHRVDGTVVKVFDTGGQVTEPLPMVYFRSNTTADPAMWTRWERMATVDEVNTLATNVIELTQCQEPRNHIVTFGGGTITSDQVMTYLYPYGQAEDKRLTHFGDVSYGVRRNVQINCTSSTSSAQKSSTINLPTLGTSDEGARITVQVGCYHNVTVKYLSSLSQTFGHQILKRQEQLVFEWSESNWWLLAVGDPTIA